MTPEPEHQIVSGEDVGILERLKNPTTGETWHAPEEIEPLDIYASDRGLGPDRFFAVGTHGGATIVTTVPSAYNFYAEGYGISGLLEVDGDGVRWIACPSTREADPCLPTPIDLRADVTIDSSTHFDSLTYPRVTSPTAEWNLGTAPEANVSYPEVAYFGTALTFPGMSVEDGVWTNMEGAERVPLAQLGASTLVEFNTNGDVPGTTAVRYAIETPFGSIVWLGHWSGNTWNPSTVNGSWYSTGAVTWDDGVDTFNHPLGNVAEHDPARPVPASAYCLAPDDVLLNAFDPSQWVKAGTHSEGPTVYLPVEGGNDIAKATWSWMNENSWADEVEPDLTYAYPEYKDFLADRSVFAWERPDGAWVLSINSNARQHVYECS